MKKIIFVITIAIAAVCSFTGCEKEDMSQTKSVPATLQNIDFSNINVQNGMLSFDSWQQYEQVAQALAEACEEHVRLYIDSIIKVLGTDDEDTINEKIEQDGFSQFQPLHDFEKSLNFNSLYVLMENAEKIWMDDVSATVEDNPFNSIDVERYESALYNSYGDVMVAGVTYHAKNTFSSCQQSGSKKGTSDIFTYKGKQRYIQGKISTTTISIKAATTLYTIKSNGKKQLWFNQIFSHISGSKAGSCSSNEPNCIFPSNGKNRLWRCYLPVTSMRGTGPTYLIVGGNYINSEHKAVNADVTLNLSL